MHFDFRKNDVLFYLYSTFHPILRFSSNLADEVAGTVFELTEAELIQADDYEVDAYVRLKAVLKSGTECWIYAAASDTRQ